MEIKKEDLNLIAIDLLDLRFNKGDFSLLCDYVYEKLKKDGVDIEIDTIKETGTFNKIGYNYSMETKRTGIKEMVSKVVTSGEDRGLTGSDTLGVWLNHCVEHMSRHILDSLTAEIIDITRMRRTNMWEVWGRMPEEQKTIKEDMFVDVCIVDTMWERTEKNIKEIRHKLFVEYNKYAY